MTILKFTCFNSSLDVLGNWEATPIKMMSATIVKIMKKIVTATIATAGLDTIAFAGHDAQAAEQNNNGYNSNDAQSYSYT